jgi:hypothetical protein
MLHKNVVVDSETDLSCRIESIAKAELSDGLRTKVGRKGRLVNSWCQAGLPDDLFPNPKSQFGEILEGLM